MKKNLSLGKSKAVTLSLLSAGLVNGAIGQSNELPNIIVIFTDDQGYGDLGCFGSENIKTPTIDSLARHGVKFTNFYVSQAVSSASRASLLTGCYPNRIGLTGALSPNASHGLAANELTIAEMLKERGYSTGIFGKWHLGDQYKFLPLQHGFDEYVGWPYSNDMWPVSYGNEPLPKTTKGKGAYPTLQLIEGNKKTQEFNSIEDQNNITKLLTERAIDFINRKSDNPFFLYFPHPMPHVPLGVSDKFSGKSEYGRYGDVIMEIDWSVNQIIKTLKENGVYENTLIIFTSDNGPWKNFGNHAGTTIGLREGKGTSWEGGHKVPCVMSWPGKIPEGIVIKHLASTLDILPSLAEIVGGTLPNHIIDGTSILPMMMGDTAITPRSIFAYYYNDNELQAIREGDWKLVFPHTYRSYKDIEPGKNGLPGKYNFCDSGLELYNLKSDPNELNNLINNANNDLLERLQFIADNYRYDLGDFLTGAEGHSVRNPGYIYEMETAINNMALGSKVILNTEYSKKYTGRGPDGLTDGIIGRPSFKDRAWQAYYGNNLNAIINFEQELKFDSVIVSTLINEESWIFPPEVITVWYSKDGINYKLYDTFSTVDFKETDIPNKFLAILNKSVSAISIKIEAINIGVCPKGHIAEGKPAWIFFDEIIVR